MDILAPHSTSDRITELGDKLRPSPTEYVLKAIGSLMASGLQIPPGIEPADVNKVYTFALSTSSQYGLMAAIRKILTGELPVNRGYMPLPTELASMARQCDAGIREMYNRARRDQKIKEDMEADKATVKDPQVVERVRKKLEAFRVQNKAFKEAQRGAPPEMPMTPEQAEYYKAILTIPDRHEPTAEERAFRSKIETKLEAGQ